MKSASSRAGLRKQSKPRPLKLSSAARARRASTEISSFPSIDWIRPLATPYLRSYRPRAQQTGELRGYWFVAASASAQGGARAVKQKTERGFFVGFLADSGEYAFLDPQPPECIVFAYVHPAGSAAHKRLVVAPDSLIRKTSTYVRWLTHHLPRFSFHQDTPAVLVRHQSMREWPREKWKHFSHNFFVETLAWLVRSALVRRLPLETASR